MSIKDGANLYAKTPKTILDPPPKSAPETSEPPKPAGTVKDGFTMYAGTRGAEYQAAHTQN